MMPNSSTKDQQKSREVAEKEHAVVCTLISRIGRCKETLKAKRGPAQRA
jgi:hypothetical protein